LRCIIGLDGSAEKIEVEEGHELLVPAATEALSQWMYKSLVLGGKAVESQTRVAIIFQLLQEQKRAESH
jgi:periplasmic protein TonB